MALLRIFFLVCLCIGSLAGAEPKVVSLTGNLGKEEIARAKEQLAELEPQQEILLELDSTSGNLLQVLELAKQLYELKAEKQARVIVYLKENAIGPAAVLPFLGDELYGSYFISWGDIPLGTDEVLPTNILRSRVRSLIGDGSPNAALLRVIAEAMSDPALTLIDDKGWRIGQATEGELISGAGETLVLNQNQLKKLGLVKETLSLEAFRRRYFPGESTQPVQEQPKAKVGIEAKLAKAIQVRAGENRIGYIAIKDKSQISQATWVYIKNALDYYKENPPLFVILELNTPGGEVFAAQKISDALKELDTQYNIPVVTYINNWAISAGAMLAYSTRFIALAKDASMGAAEPVIAGGSGQMEAASEKVNSALRSDFANRAGFFDRNPDIAEAMVDKDIILVWRFGEVVRLEDEDQIRSSGPNPDEVITRKGKLLTLNASELLRYGVADFELPTGKIELISAKERLKGKWPASKMQLFQYPFFKSIPDAVVDAYQMDWKTQFFVLLSYPAVSSLLFLGLMLGFYAEINSPGFGLPGSVAILCLVLILLSSFSLEIANLLEVIFLLVGLLLVALDLFLIPTFGILGIAGVILFLVGLFGIMLPGIESVSFEMDSQTFNAAGEAFMQRLAWLSGTLVLGVGLMFLMGRYLAPSFAGFSRLVLTGGEQNARSGYYAGQDPAKLPKPGTKGEALTTLRPSGKVLIEDKIYEAVTGGEFVDKGAKIIVSHLEGGVMVVDPLEEKE